MKRDLKGQGRFSYARLTSDQYQRTFDQTASKDTVHFPVVQRNTVLY
jgi:hypothetical protein